MDDPDAQRLVAHLAAEGGERQASTNLDPQWNAATAETKHRQDLALRLVEDAGLDRGPDEVGALLDALAERRLVERATSAERATVRLTEAGDEASGDRRGGR